LGTKTEEEGGTLIISDGGLVSDTGRGGELV